MSTLAFLFEGNGAHAGALPGLTLVATMLGAGRWVLGIGLVALPVWAHVLAYLGYARGRLTTRREGRGWSRGQQLIALGVIVANDSRIDTASVPVVLGGVVGAFVTLALLSARIDFLALPTWALVLLVLPLTPLVLPLGLGSAAYRTQRYTDVVDLELT